MLIIITCATLSATIVTAAQSPAAQTREPLPQGLALRSCTPIADSTANRFTISKPRSPKSWYRSAGTLLLQTGRRVHVAGGLIPSPNIAAQAGSLDPTVPAMAMASGDAFRRPAGVARKPAVALAAQPPGVRVDCAVR
jgi:hypothetical protein